MLCPVQFLVVHSVDISSIYLFICVAREHKWVFSKSWGSEINSGASPRANRPCSLFLGETVNITNIRVCHSSAVHCKEIFRLNSGYICFADGCL